MKLSYWMIAKAVIVTIFGIGFVLMPTPLMMIYGVTLNQAGAFMTQLFGASFILLGIVLWLARNASRAETTLGALVLAIVIADTIGFVVSLLGQLSGVANALGWLIVALYLVLALGFGYFQFLKPNAS